MVVGDFAGCDGGLWDYGGELDVAGDFSDGRDSEGSFWWMDYGWRCNLLRCFAGDQ